MYEFNGNSHNNGLSNNRNKIPEVLKKSAGMNSMMWMADGDGLQSIGHMNSIAARVASSRKLPVEKETNEGGRQKYKSCDRLPGDVASAYAVITNNRRNTVTIIGYHGMSQRCDSNKNYEPPTVAMEKYMRKKIKSLKQQHPPCTPGTYKRSTMGFEKATWINNPI
jgi:hypothetical protein